MYMIIKNKHSFINNFVFVLRKILQHDKLLLVLPIISIPISFAINFINLFLPKVVLDGIEKRLPIIDYMKNILLVVLPIMIFVVLLKFIDNETLKHNWLFNCALEKELDFKTLDMDYQNFSSPKIKNEHYKAIMSVDGWSGNNIKELYPTITSLITSILLILSYFWILSKVNIALILLLFVSNFLSIIVAIIVGKRINKTKETRADITKKFEYIAYKTMSISAAKDIRIFSMSNWITALSKIYKDKHFYWENNVASKKIWQGVFNVVLMCIRDCISYVYLIHMILNNYITVGDFAVYLSAIIGFGDCLHSIIDKIEKIKNCNWEVCDYRTFMETKDKMNRSATNTIPHIENPIEIRLENVSYMYPQSNKLVLDNISLTINPGEKIAIVGVNGAGKTTLVKLICGLLSPTSGYIYVNGKEISEYNRDEYYRLFSAVFQDISVLPTTIKDNIIFGDNKYDEMCFENSINMSGINEKIMNLDKHELTRLVKMVFEDSIELSGGEIQKLQLARAIYHQSAIMILDEPTAALDPIAENKLYIKYDMLAKNKTSIFISHRLASTRFCDRILLLNNGRISEMGSHRELMLYNGIYASMYKEQSKYYKEKRNN